MLHFDDSERQMYSFKHLFGGQQRFDIDSKKRNELGVILISFLNCFKLSCLVLLQITIPDLSLFAESTCIVTAQLNLSDSHHYQENFKSTLKAFLDWNFISSQMKYIGIVPYWFYDADSHLNDLI